MKEEECKKREKRKRTRTIVTYSPHPPLALFFPSSASNQPIEQFCNVAMMNVTHTTIFSIRRSDTPTSQNQPI